VVADDESHGTWGLLGFTAIYGGIAAGSALGAATTTGWVAWALAALAALFSAITLWMLPFCALFVGIAVISLVSRLRGLDDGD
jgi:hypothetical protein